MILDINVTSTCNLGCKYCSEGHNPEMPDLAKIENSKTDVKTLDLINFISRVKKKTPDEKFTIAFWGGEPMMNMRYCLDLMKFYKNDTKFDFFFYTNGMYIKKYRSEIDEINKQLGKDRFKIQISYDGKAINDIERVTKSGTSTSELVKEAFGILTELGVNTTFKSTVTPKTFKYMYESFLDITNLSGSHYFPTPDSFHDTDPDKEEEYLADLKLSLMKIARHIYEHNMPIESFSWFRNNKALCQAGINYFGINLDGKLSPCHSTMYAEYNDHEFGDLRDLDILDKIDNTTTMFKDLLAHMNDDCTNCDALYCMKCPAGSYNVPTTKQRSEIKLLDLTKNPKNLTKYEMQWTTKNINMCKVFKINDLVHKALLFSTKQNPKPANEKRCDC